MMASLLWTVLLSTLLWAQTSQALDETEWAQTSQALDETELGELIANLLNVYRPTYQVHGVFYSDTPTFTLAVSIPYNTVTRRYDFSQVTAVDNGQTVINSLNNCQVYVGNRVIGAMVLKWPNVKYQCPSATIPTEWAFVRKLCPNVQTWGDLGQCNKIKIKFKKQANLHNGAVDHAEYRVLKRFNHFINRLNNGDLNQNDLMLFYSYKSPCDSRCASLTNSLSIIQSIKSINRWPNHALVFSKIFVPTNSSFNPDELEKNRRSSLNNLGNAIGVRNIYRCRVGANRCTSCGVPSGAGDKVSVSDTCVSDDTEQASTSPSPNGK